MMEHNKARRAEPHAATPPDDPANPGLEQELRNILFIDPNKPRESGAIWPVYPEHFDEVWPQVQALITRREAKAYDQGYERGRRDVLEEGRRMTSGGDYKAGPEYFTSRLNELEKGKPSNGNLRSLEKGGKPDGE